MTGKLRLFTHLPAKTDCLTRGSSTAAIVQRFKELSEYCIQYNWDNDELLLFNRAELKTFSYLHGKYNQLNLIITALQSDTTSCRDIRD